MTMQNKRIIASILFVLISSVCIAQGQSQDRRPPHPQGGPPGGPPVPPGLPIDGGVLIGAVFAAAYGARKLYLAKK